MLSKMKNLWVLIAILPAVFMACQSDDGTAPDPQVIVNEVSASVKEGSWIITYYAEDTEVKTSNYSGFSFVFGSDGTLTANKNSDSFTGSWSVSHESGDDSNDDNPHSEFEDIDFNIHFTTPVLLAELSEDWEIVSQMDGRIELKHVSGGDGSIDYLTFEKS